MELAPGAVQVGTVPAGDTWLRLHGAEGDTALAVQATGDTFDRFSVRPDGTAAWTANAGESFPRLTIDRFGKHTFVGTSDAVSPSGNFVTLSVTQMSPPEVPPQNGLLVERLSGTGNIFTIQGEPRSGVGRYTALFNGHCGFFTSADITSSGYVGEDPGDPKRACEQRLGYLRYMIAAESDLGTAGREGSVYLSSHDGGNIDHFHFRSGMPGDLWAHMEIGARGEIRWGQGTTAPDIELKRESANVLSLSKALSVVGLDLRHRVGITGGLTFWTPANDLGRFLAYSPDDFTLRVFDLTNHRNLAHFLRSTPGTGQMWVADRITVQAATGQDAAASAFEILSPGGALRMAVRGNDAHLFLANVLAPPTAPAGGGTLYVQDGALKYKNTAGVVTQVAP